MRINTDASLNSGALNRRGERRIRRDMFLQTLSCQGEQTVGEALIISYSGSCSCPFGIVPSVPVLATLVFIQDGAKF